MIWYLSNLDKKNAVEIQYWNKDGVTFTKTVGYRWGQFFCESDEKPDVDLNNEDGFSLDSDWEMDYMDDDCWSDWEYPDSMSQEERDEIETAWNENYYEGLEALGWENKYTDQILYGPLRLVNKDTNEEFTGVK